jgi:hypothetical protein
MTCFTADRRPPARVCRVAVRSAAVYVGIVVSDATRRCVINQTWPYMGVGVRRGWHGPQPRLMFLLDEDVQGTAEP